MKRILTLICLTSAAAGVFAETTDWQPTDGFLQAVRAVESSNGLYTSGDNGASLGEFQLSEAAWLDVNQYRKARGLKTYRYDRSVYNGYISRAYASNYLSILHSELSRKLRRPPTHSELYAAYNLGLTSFAQCEFKLNRVNPVTREKCRQIGALLGLRG